MSQTEGKPFEIVWYRHPQVWLLFAAIIILMIILFWTLVESGSELSNEKARTKEVKQAFESELDQARQEKASQAAGSKVRELQVLGLSEELKTAQMRLREVESALEAEVSARKLLEGELVAEKTRGRATAQLLELESQARKKLEDSQKSLAQSVPSPPAAPQGSRVGQTTRTTHYIGYGEVVRLRDDTTITLHSLRERLDGRISAAFYINGTENPFTDPGQRLHHGYEKGSPCHFELMKVEGGRSTVKRGAVVDYVCR